MYLKYGKKYLTTTLKSSKYTNCISTKYNSSFKSKKLKLITGTQVCRFNTTVQPSGTQTPSRVHGNLSDKDRIFVNLYNDYGYSIDNAMKRGDWHQTKDILLNGPDWIIDEIKRSGMLPNNYIFRIKRKRRSWFPFRLKVFFYA